MDTASPRREFCTDHAACSVVIYPSIVHNGLEKSCLEMIAVDH